MIYCSNFSFNQAIATSAVRAPFTIFLDILKESEKLHKQVDEYQHELATLQTSHSQKIASLTRKYKNDLQLWQKEKEDLMNSIVELRTDLEHHQNHDSKNSLFLL